VRSLRTKLESLGAGSTYKEVSRGTVRNLAICLPSKVEQKKIGEILSHTDEAIRKTNQIISNIERLRKGLLQKLLTRGIGHKEFKYSEELGTEIPMKWKIGRISDYCSVGTGGTPSRKHPEYFDGDMPWVKSTEIDYGMITRSEESISSLGLRNSNAKVYPVGTLVIAMYGQGVTRGRCAILGIEAAINQACAAILPKDVDETHIPFLYNWCQFNYEKIRNLGQGANQLNLNLSLVRSIAVALPPFEEQKRITEILESVERKLDLERKEKAKVEKAKQGLMNLLLAGKIRIKVD
jgi:type I restriction enzyme S subunit